MPDVLFWLYLTNSILIISHEIDSAYWKEWEIFRIPGGITGFLLLHFPLLFFILYGLVLVSAQSGSGLVFSIVLGSGGLSAFSIHAYFLKKGREEFGQPISKMILVLTGIISVIQLAIALYLLVAREAV